MIYIYISEREVGEGGREIEEGRKRKGENAENILSLLAIFNSHFHVWSWQKFGEMISIYIHTPR